VAYDQLTWLNEATGDVKVFRAMVVGWQTVRETLNSTVLRFNKHHFAETSDPHNEMKVVAAKQIVVASLRELRLRLDEWHNRLRVKGVLSQTTVDLRRRILPSRRKRRAQHRSEAKSWRWRPEGRRPDHAGGIGTRSGQRSTGHLRIRTPGDLSQHRYWVLWCVRCNACATLCLLRTRPAK
jgi:hypothetical protein